MSGVIAAAGITAASGLASGLLSNKGGAGGGAPGTQMLQTNAQYPGWVNQGAQDIWGKATNNYYNYMPAYTGQRVADLTPETRNLISQLYGNVGSTNAPFGTAMAGTNALMGFNPSMVTPQMLSGTSLSPYMSPYTQSVIDPTMRLMEQQRQGALNQIGAQARQTGAFGGSRQGVQEGATNAQYGLNEAQMAGNLWNQNFGQAQAAATGDIQRNMMAQQLNQAAGLQGAQFRGNMAQQYANLAQGQQQNWLSGMQAAMGGQQMLTQQQQAQLDAARQAYAEQQDWETNRLKTYAGFLTGLPYGQTTTQTGPGPQTNPFLTGLGTAATTAGILGQAGLFNKNNWLSGTSPNTYSYPSPAQNAMFPEFAPSTTG